MIAGARAPRVSELAAYMEKHPNRKPFTEDANS